MADINIQEVTNHINIETTNGYKLEFNGPVVNMNVVLSNYYTKTETDALLNDKADKADTYTISQINGMVQDINTAIDTKQDIITGAASTITDSNLTTNRAVISNASGKVAVSNVTSTELGYLSGVKSGVQTQLNNKASTSLDNLSSAGQMIIDSQNGTISNCILEIPQNLKLTLENNVLTLKSGSILTKTGDTYATVTTTKDITFTVSGNDNRYAIFSNNSQMQMIWIKYIGSGSTLPSDSSNYYYFYNTTDKLMYHWINNSWSTAAPGYYPICLIEISNGVASFTKDSNGNDMIFNGAGFIGHHAFRLPNVSGYTGEGFTSGGKLNSNFYSPKNLIIQEMVSTNPSYDKKVIGFQSATRMNYIEVDTVAESPAHQHISWIYTYVKEQNNMWVWTGTVLVKQHESPLVYYNYNGTTVTDFAIRQPYQGARNLLTDDLYKQIGDVETLLATV